MNINLLIIPLITLMFAGCTAMTGPDASTSDQQQPTPETVATESSSFIDTEIEWGGIIARTNNLERTTELEIIAYPLNKNSRPDTESRSIGRFIATHKGYLEAVDYAKGRRVTVKGAISGVLRRTVNMSEFVFPELNVKEIKLWPKGSEQRVRPSFHIGIGIGSGHAHGGIGIGF